MRITIRYFASVREALGCAEEEVSLPPEVKSVHDLQCWLAARGGEWQQKLDPASPQARALRHAFQMQMCSPQQLLQDGAEVAFFPPVTGG